MSTESIHEYFLKNERNLQIAVAVSQAWPEARARLVKAFLDRLSTKLLAKLPEWSTDLEWGEFLVDKWPCFRVTKKTWTRQYYIGLQATDGGASIVFGVLRDQEKPLVAARPLSAEVLQVVRQLHPSARPQKWWDAIITMRSPAPNWRGPDVLWRLHSDQEFLESVAEQLLGIASAVEHLLDEITRPTLAP